MAGSVYGTILRLSTFGESHGKAIGGVIDGFPAGFEIDPDAVQREMDRRRPGQSALVSQRKESDTVEFLSGIFEGKTTGTPIAFVIRNEDQRSRDYEHIKAIYRPSHADKVYDDKYGIRDYRGGGRSSARETACRVVAGALAKQFLEASGIHILAYVDQVGTVREQQSIPVDVNPETLRGQIERSPVRCLSAQSAEAMEDLIRRVRSEGDTIGGAIRAYVTGVPAGLGEPVFDKLHAELGKAMLSINAVKGFEIGSGFGCIEMRGSEHNDLISPDGSTRSNFSGGIQGGISNGMPLDFRVAFKPVATIVKAQETVDNTGKPAVSEGKGRHDPCVVPRAVPIVEAMTALVLMDMLLRNRSAHSE